LVQRVLAGRPAAHVAAETAGLVERSSKPHHSPRRTPALVEAQILALCHDRRLGPARIGAVWGLPPSTCTGC
jgi:hypothetical protein